MRHLITMIGVLFAYLRPGILGTGASSFGSSNPSAPNAASIEANGGIMSIGGLTGYLASLQANAAPQTGYLNYKQLASGTTVTLNQATLPGGIAGACVVMTGSTATALTLDATQSIINALPGAFVGQTFPFIVANPSTGAQTLTVGDANTSLAGTTTAASTTVRFYQGLITNLAAPGTTPAAPSANAPGAAPSNTTTTTAAVAAAVPSLTTVSSVIPVTASTGMIANQTVLQVTQSDGSVINGLVTNIASLNITIGAVNTKPILSGASVSVWNPKVTVTGMFTFAPTSVSV